MCLLSENRSIETKDKSKFQYCRTSNRLSEMSVSIWQVPNTVHLRTKVIDTKTTHYRTHDGYLVTYYDPAADKRSDVHQTALFNQNVVTLLVRLPHTLISSTEIHPNPHHTHTGRGMQDHCPLFVADTHLHGGAEVSRTSTKNNLWRNSDVT